jgi:hypothetical protein
MFFGFDNITVGYGKKIILEGLTLDFPRGSITTILGANGSGKSTLLKTIPGTVKPIAGQVILEGKALLSYSKKEISQTIGYLPQSNYTPEDITVRTLVSYGRFPYRKRFGSLTSFDKEVVDETLEKCKLTHLAERKVHTLSGGERKLAWIAVILAQKPKVLVLDEPVTYLDIGHQVDILELITAIGKKDGLTIVMVLHDINLSARYSDRLAVINSGSILAADSPATVLTSELLKNVYCIGSEILTDTKHRCPLVVCEKLKPDQQ